MPTLRSTVVACLAALFGSAAHAQIFTLFGEVTALSGAYVSEFSSGDLVTLSLDLSAPLNDELAGTFSNAALYHRSATLTVDGRELPLLPEIGIFFDQRPTSEGLYIFHTWGSSGSNPGGQLAQNFLGGGDILPSFGHFPPDVPIGEFSSVGGYYRIRTDDDATLARVDWVITSYRGEAGAPMTPVPEPSTYAAIAAAGLFGAIAARRRQAASGLSVLRHRLRAPRCRIGSLFRAGGSRLLGRRS